MCVDDYQFRCYTTTRPKECRRFVIIDEFQIQKAFIVNISQFEQDNQVALCLIFHHLETKGLQLKGRSIYMPKYNISFTLGNQCMAPFEALQDKQILFRSYIGEIPKSQIQHHQKQMEIQQNVQLNPFTATQHQSEKFKYQQNIADNIQDNIQELQNFVSNSSEQRKNISQLHNPTQEMINHSKRIKQPQRQIGEVIMAVKKWRTLYQYKKISLTKGATLLGISKKSLDDYFLVLRVGQILGFDYKNNLNKKMGDLRSFIRSCDKKITGKLPKQVKCFECVPVLCSDQLLQELSDKIAQQKSVKESSMDEQKPLTQIN